MTETVGTTNLLNQPIDALLPEQAAERRAALAGDPQFQQRINARDPEAFTEHLRLWRREHNLPADPQPVVNTANVFEQASERAMRETETRAEILRRDGLNNVQVYEVLNQRPQSIEAQRLHEEEFQRLKVDEGFQARLRAKDREARYDWARHLHGRRLPVATMEQIEAWERAHSDRKPKA